MNRESNRWRPGLDLAIIGMSGRFPGAKNIDEFWDNLKNGRETISFFSEQEIERAGLRNVVNSPDFVKAASVVDDIQYFDASFFGYTPREAERMDPQTRIFHECVWTALENAGYVSHTYKGAIGLYGGGSNNPLWEFLVLQNEQEYFEAFQYTDKDHLCTRVSHNLNLRGPSFIIETQCSTGLVAFHLACQGLLSGECDMAAAGGISMTELLNHGYQTQEGMIFSQDGHCRAFDKKANGIIFGNGAGVVVLKRIEEAINAGDHIYAIVKASALNNDGSNKISYSAPSVDGQATVIRTALRLAQVETESISYIETHGTGTSLGDPIEMQALKIAFKSDKKGFCRIGSAKTNMGHLDNAAGITGLIKTVLSLKHKMIPPCLHFETPNPAIDFENSPFMVNTRLTPWENGPYPLRAGVSSFGIGGTNVHVILEEWPEDSESGGQWVGRSGDQGVNGQRTAGIKSREHQLILLSAKTATALDNITKNLAEFLQRNPNLDPADLAYTLQVGRAAMEYRKMLVCRDIPGALEWLASSGTAKTPAFFLGDPKQRKKIIFLFAGLGSQYVDMGRDLFEKEPVFRQEMDRCFEILKPLTDIDIKGILYPAAPGGEGSEVSEGSKEGNRKTRPENPHHSSFTIHHFEVAQLAVFIFEYALTKLIGHWGIKPDALMGYSFGEYAAACAAGVFSLEHVLKLVVARGQSMRRVPEGAMLSVPLTADDIAPLLNPGVSLAIDNGPSCVVAGSPQAIDNFEKQMKEKKLMCMRVQASHALHSSMMAPILTELGDIITTLTLNRPKIPYISNVTGDWITDQQAQSPQYWTSHLKQTVRFADGMKKLVTDPNSIFIEIGPGRDISALALRHIETGANKNQPVINLVRAPHQNLADTRYLLDKIGHLWLYGQTIDWAGFYSREKRQRIVLPTYPFEGERFWAEGEKPVALLIKMFSSDFSQAGGQDMSNWFYLPSWKLTITPLALNPGEIKPDERKWLVFVDDCGLGMKIFHRLVQAGIKATAVRKGDRFSRGHEGNEKIYTINPGSRQDYDALIKDLLAADNPPAMILHLWGVTPGSPGQSGIDLFNRYQHPGFYSLVFLARALDEQGVIPTAGVDDQGNKTRPLQMIVVANQVLAVTGNDAGELCPEKITIIGPCKTIPLEYPLITCRLIDVALPGTEEENEIPINQLLKEFLYETDKDTVVAYRGGDRWTRFYEPLPLGPPAGPPSRLKREGVYLITGGLGNDSMARAKYLAETLKARLVLTGRTPLPPREKWHQWLDIHPQEDAISLKIKNVQELEKLGARVLVTAADVSNEEDMRRVMEQIDREFGTLDGVIHAAGITSLESSVIISKLGYKESQWHFTPKVYGLYVLKKVLAGRKIDFCLLTSSIISVLGGGASTAYTAASNFMDTFAARQYHLGEPWISLNWEGVSPGETAEAFQRIMSLGPVPQVVVSTDNLEKRIEYRRRQAISQLEAGRKKVKKYNRPNLLNPYEAPGNEAERKIVEIWEDTLGFNPVGVRDDFLEMRGDSLKAISIIAKIEKELQIKLTLAEFFQRPNIKELATYAALKERTRYSPIEPMEKKEYYPLSSVHKRLYFLQKLLPRSIIYNEYNALTIEMDLDKDKLEKTIYQLIHRHDSMRTGFQVIEGELVQRVYEPGDVEFGVEYYSADTGDMAIEKILKNFIRPFDLSQPPLLRIGMVKPGENQTVIFTDIHHIIADGLSQYILNADFLGFYSGEDPEPLRLQYKDFTQWQNKEIETGKIKQQGAYWLKLFAGNIPVLNLPLDYERPEVQSFEGRRVKFVLGPEESRQLKTIALAEEVTLFMLFLAIYNMFLSKITGQDDIVVGTVTAGRDHPDLANIFGMFVNTLAFRNRPRAGKTFKSFLKEVKQNTFNAFENREYPFENLVAQLTLDFDKSRNPLADVFYTFDAPEFQKELSNKNLQQFGYQQQTSKTDLGLVGIETETTLSFDFEYCTKLFKESTIQQFIRYFKEIVSAVAENKDIKLEDIKISHDFFDQKIAVPETDFGF